jgi:hypothetical protein
LETLEPLNNDNEIPEEEINMQKITDLVSKMMEEARNEVKDMVMEGQLDVKGEGLEEKLAALERYISSEKYSNGSFTMPSIKEILTDIENMEKMKQR